MRRKSLSKRDPRHGSVNGYVNYLCRCQRCRKAWAKYHKAYMDRHPEQQEKARMRQRERRERKTEAAA
jgi:hypothetical protein